MAAQALKFGGGGFFNNVAEIALLIDADNRESGDAFGGNIGFSDQGFTLKANHARSRQLHQRL